MAWAWIAVALADSTPPLQETTAVVQVHSLGVGSEGRVFSNREAAEQTPSPSTSTGTA